MENLQTYLGLPHIFQLLKGTAYTNTTQTILPKKIFDIDGQNGSGPSQKYKYLTEPYNSTNITFEIENVTLGDAGYYNGGAQADAATACGGVVLIVYGEYI